MLFYNHFRTPEEILGIMLDNKGTVLAGVPTVLQGCQAEMSKNPEKYEKLRGVWDRATCGGSAPPPAMIEWYWKTWGKLKLKIILSLFAFYFLFIYFVLFFSVLLLRFCALNLNKLHKQTKTLIILYF